jgi:hypothetical protein
MSKLGEGAAQAEVGVHHLETVLERTEKALQAAERVDRAAAEAGRRSGKFLKMLLLLTVVGVAVMAARKLLAGSEAPAGSTAPDRSGSSTGTGPTTASDDVSGSAAAVSGTGSNGAVANPAPEVPTAGP